MGARRSMYRRMCKNDNAKWSDWVGKSTKEECELRHELGKIERNRKRRKIRNKSVRRNRRK